CKKQLAKTGFYAPAASPPIGLQSMAPSQEVGRQSAETGAGDRHNGFRLPAWTSHETRTPRTGRGVNIVPERDSGQLEGWGSIPPSGSGPFLRRLPAPAFGTAEPRLVGVSSPMSREGFLPARRSLISSPLSVSYSSRP